MIKEIVNTVMAILGGVAIVWIVVSLIAMVVGEVSTWLRGGKDED